MAAKRPPATRTVEFLDLVRGQKKARRVRLPTRVIVLEDDDPQPPSPVVPVEPPPPLLEPVPQPELPASVVDLLNKCGDNKQALEGAYMMFSTRQQWDYASAALARLATLRTPYPDSDSE